MKQVHSAVISAVLVISATISRVHAGEVAEQMAAFKLCMQENGVTLDDLRMMHKTGDVSQKIKCTMSCTLQALGLMKEDGSMDDYYNELKKNLETNPSEVATNYTNCLSKALLVTDTCERGFVYHDCITTIDVQFEPEAEEALKECMQENGVNIDDVQKMYKTDNASQELKCALSCTAQSLGMMNEDGSIDTPSEVAKAMDLDPSDAALTRFANCRSKAMLSTETCERGYVYFNCTMKIDIKLSSK